MPPIVAAPTAPPTESFENWTMTLNGKQEDKVLNLRMT
jgi:hypothetical protein